jgi:hypothetical protein
MHREDQLADYQRQDAVAKHASDTATALAEQQETIIRQQHEAGEAARIRDDTSHVLLSRIDAQAERIHTLVNSEMTAAREEEMQQAEKMIVILKRVIAAARSKGANPDPEDLAALALVQDRRDTLEQILADRMHQLRESEDTLKLTEAGRRLDDEDTNKKNRDKIGENDGGAGNSSGAEDTK